jgi:hypothetical protein
VSTAAGGRGRSIQQPAFPELVSAPHPRVGPVGRIAYNLGLREPAPREQPLDGRVIRYGVFHTIDPTP